MNREICLVVCFIVGVLAYHLLKNSCGCNNVVEGANDPPRPRDEEETGSETDVVSVNFDVAPPLDAAEVQVQKSIAEADKIVQYYTIRKPPPTAEETECIRQLNACKGEPRSCGDWPDNTAPTSITGTCPFSCDGSDSFDGMFPGSVCLPVCDTGYTNACENLLNPACGRSVC